VTAPEELTALARRAARRYKRKCWWADERDLRQTAALALLEAQRNYDPQTGIPFEGYAWKVMINQLHGAVLRASAPVSAPHHKLPDLKGLYRAALDDGLVDLRADPYRVLAALEKQARMKAALDDILADEHDHQIARDVLLRDLKPRAVAASRGVPIEQVYVVVRRVKDRIGKSYACWLLLHE
jgi:RNA polymerase sigma factor (sigma-70 family)